ncbi:hypothetical protein APR08_005541 [Nocardia amikacinitolerans]|nr:hypothetical protein [Nocardia amikacinitolerans]
MPGHWTGSGVMNGRREHGVLDRGRECGVPDCSWEQQSSAAAAIRAPVYPAAYGVVGAVTALREHALAAAESAGSCHPRQQQSGAAARSTLRVYSAVSAVTAGANMVFLIAPRVPESLPPKGSSISSAAAVTWPSGAVASTMSTSAAASPP